MKSNQNNLNTQSLILICYQKHFLTNNILGKEVSLLQPDFMNKISNKLFPTEIKMNFILHHFGEWLSGLRRYIQNLEIPSSNPTARSVGLGVLTLLQSSRWPSGRIHNMSEKHRVAKAVSLSVAQSCLGAAKWMIKKESVVTNAILLQMNPPTKTTQEFWSFLWTSTFITQY